VSNVVQQPAATAPGLAPVVFLDTNAVQYATLTLSFASAHGIDLATEDVANIKAAVKAQGLGAEDYYAKGAWIVRYLIRRASENAVYWYSPVTTLELLCGALRGEAVKRAANIGVPNRWFTHLAEPEVWTHLEPDGYAAVQTQRINVEALFDAANIVLNEQRLEKEVWVIARTLMENVFIGVQDCVIYASALVAQADELITIDSFFRKAACYTTNPGGAPQMLVNRFQAVRDAIVNACSQEFLWPIDKVVVPTAVNVEHIRKYFGGTSP
jgi:hypothetical protein